MTNKVMEVASAKKIFPVVVAAAAIAAAVVIVKAR